LGVRRLDLGLAREPALAEPVDDPGKIFAEHLPKLAFNFALDVLLNHGDRVKRAAHVDILERVGFEDEGDAFLFRNNEDNIGV
jgi:hypothetical protein